MGHAEPFAFVDDYRPAEGMLKFLTGTPSILALAALDAGLATFDGIAMRDLAAKSRALSQLFIDEVEARCGDAVRLASPRDPAQRGSHVVFAHPDGYAVMQALIARGVIGDFRAPDLMRFGFAPLYNRFADMVRAAEILGDILSSARMGPAALQGARARSPDRRVARPGGVHAPRARRRPRRDRGRRSRTGSPPRPCSRPAETLAGSGP